jgi:hypothetical protein
MLTGKFSFSCTTEVEKVDEKMQANYFHRKFKKTGELRRESQLNGLV